MNLILIIQLVIILATALFVLTRASDIFIDSASKLGKYFGMSPFVIGVLIVGMGTSLPELATSLAAIFDDSTEIIVANVVGSNITNILLIVGVMSFWGGTVVIRQKLIKTELPIFFIATVHFAAVMFDGRVDRIEGLLLLGTFCAYLWYLLVESQSSNNPDPINQVALPLHEEKKTFPLWELIQGIISLTVILLAASYAVTAVVQIATELSVPIDFISITAIAIGTSLPELFVTLRAIKSKHTEMAIGNIFGSSAFNMLVIVGLSATITPLLAGDVVMNVGLGIMLAASAILFVSGLARQIMRWEGLMMLIFFVFFLVKLMAFV